MRQMRQARRLWSWDPRIYPCSLSSPDRHLLCLLSEQALIHSTAWPVCTPALFAVRFGMAQAMQLPCCQLPRASRAATCSTSRAAHAQPLCRAAPRQPQHAQQMRHRRGEVHVVAGQPQAPPQVAPRCAADAAGI